MSEYVFDHRLADCERCPLAAQREQTECLGQAPQVPANGLVIVGEGPGVNEARLKVPFCGRSGQLLDALLAQVGVDRAACRVTNATLCLPAMGTKDKVLGAAVHACRPRLLTELAHARPRVIVALGQHALASLVGVETVTSKRVPFACAACGDVREWRLWGCAKCKTAYREFPAADKHATPPTAQTPCCAAKWQPRKVACDACEGKKTRIESTTSFSTAYTIGHAAGGLFRASHLDLGAYLIDPDGRPLHAVRAVQWCENNGDRSVDLAEVYVIGTYHPAFLLRKSETAGDKQVGGQFLASAALDHLAKARRLLTGPPSWAFDWQEVRTVEAFERYLSEPGAVAYDLETDAKDPFCVTDIRCVGLHRQGAAHTAVLVTAGLGRDAPLVRALGQMLADPERRKVAQNGPMYDELVLARVWGVVVRGQVDDTLIAHNVIAPDEPHDLSHIVFGFTDAPPWKPPRKGKDGGLVFGSPEELHAYCAADTKGTSDAMEHLHARLAREAVTQVYDLDMRKATLACSMSLYGMPVDRQAMLHIGAEAQYEMERALLEMRQIVGRLPDRVVPKAAGADRDAYALNPHSPPQLAWALYDPAGPCRFVASRFTETNAPSTDKNALLPFVEHPFVDALLRYKNNHKIKSVWLDGMPIGPDGRLHVRWNPVGARTGRWTSSPNAQNWPKSVRGMVVAPEGRMIVGADYSQLELRIIAALCGDAEMIRRCVTADESRKLDADCDPHAYVAQIAFGTAFSSLALTDTRHQTQGRCACDVCTRKHLRDIAKRVVYGLNYGAGAEKIREAIYDGGYDGPPISLSMITRVVAAYFTAFPGVPVWRDTVLRETERVGRVRDALLGRYREFPLQQIDATVAYNYPIQSTAASVMDVSAWNLHLTLPSVDPSAQIVALVHDAVYVECAEDRADAVCRAVEAHLSCVVELVPGAPPMPLPATAHAAKTWRDAA